MANAKELRKQIGSIKNTQKITSAMEMVAASKMRKAQERMSKGRPYSDHIRTVIGHVAMASPESVSYTTSPSPRDRTRSRMPSSA